jgi:hypothetical protein
MAASRQEEEQAAASSAAGAMHENSGSDAEMPPAFLRGMSTGEVLYGGGRGRAVEYGIGMEALCTSAPSPVPTRQLHLLACRECEPLAARMLATRLGKKVG